MRTWQPDWESPFGREEDSVNTSMLFAKWESYPSTPSLKEEQEMIPSARIEPAPPPRDEASTLSVDETVELLTKALGPLRRSQT